MHAVLLQLVSMATKNGTEPVADGQRQPAAGRRQTTNDTRLVRYCALGKTKIKNENKRQN